MPKLWSLKDDLKNVRIYRVLSNTMLMFMLLPWSLFDSLWKAFSSLVASEIFTQF